MIVTEAARTVSYAWRSNDLCWKNSSAPFLAGALQEKWGSHLGIIER